MRALLIATVMLAAPEAGAAHRDELCATGIRHRGQSIDLDVKDADLHDVFRLIADIGRVNVVVPDDVTGKVTLRLVRVAWDAAACAVAKLHHLVITVDGNILLVMRAAPGRL